MVVDYEHQLTSDCPFTENPCEISEIVKKIDKIIQGSEKKDTLPGMLSSKQLKNKPKMKDYIRKTSFEKKDN